MGLANNSSPTVVDGEFRHWDSPLPYLFGGIALMLGLVCFALLILACSYKSSTANGSSGKAAGKQKEMRPEMEPKIVVIMAGDENPTFLAKPVAPNALRQFNNEQV